MEVYSRKPEESGAERGLRISRNILLGLGSVGVAGNGTRAIIDAHNHVANSEFQGVAMREAVIMAATGLLIEGARRLAKRA